LKRGIDLQGELFLVKTCASGCPGAGVTMTRIRPNELVNAHISWVDVEPTDEYGDDILTVYAMTVEGVRVKISNYGVDVMKVEVDD
jgi:hypothetical protein